jgi:hypothetical protein
LARGAEIPDRESRVQDFAECHAGYRVRRVTEIWMVEKVKDFSTELKVEPFGYLRVFHYREIGVYEVGPRKRLLSVAVQRHGARDRGARNQASEKRQVRINTYLRSDTRPRHAHLGGGVAAIFEGITRNFATPGGFGLIRWLDG